MKTGFLLIDKNSFSENGFPIKNGTHQEYEVYFNKELSNKNILFRVFEDMECCVKHYYFDPSNQIVFVKIIGDINLEYDEGYGKYNLVNKIHIEEIIPSVKLSANDYQYKLSDFCNLIIRANFTNGRYRYLYIGNEEKAAILLHDKLCEDHLGKGTNVCDFEENNGIRRKYFMDIAKKLIGKFSYEDITFLIETIYGDDNSLLYSEDYFIEILNELKRKEYIIYKETLEKNINTYKNFYNLINSKTVKKDYNFVYFILRYINVDENIRKELYEIILDKSEWAYYLRLYIKDLPEDIKRMAEEKACEDPYYAYRLRVNVKDLPEDMKRKAELKACENPEWAYRLRVNVKDLSENIKRRAELKACEDPYCAYLLRIDIKDLSEDMKRKKLRKKY